MSVYLPPVFEAPIDLDLSRNEGPPLVATLDLGEDEVGALTSRYPDISGLTAAIADRHGVDPGQVLATAGGDDALFRCILAGDGPVVSTTPSFQMIGVYAAQSGRPLREVSWWEGAFPVGEVVSMADAGDDTSSTAVIVSPNNPTGSVITEPDLLEVARAFQLVVLDAAYVEFAGEDLTDIALELGNVVVVRTLSKAYGLAGLRVGYLLGSRSVVAGLGGYGSPFSVSGLSAVVATRVLETSRIEAEVAKVTENRSRLFAVLAEIGASPLPSEANFVLATRVDPEWLVDGAVSLGVGLRRFPGREGLERCVRMTVPGDSTRYERLEATLRAVLAPEAILFDLDGVLADVRGSYRAAIVATAAGYGVTVTSGDIAAAKAAGDGSDDWELTRRLLSFAGVEATFQDVRERFETIYQGEDGEGGLKTRERLLVDRALLGRWADRMPLAVVTARPRRDAEEFLSRFGIGSFFSAIVTREDAASKPDPAPIRLALELLGVAHAWMIGDTVDDIRAARAAGVVPVGVSVPGDDRGALSGAARVLDDVNDLEEVLRVTKS